MNLASLTLNFLDCALGSCSSPLSLGFSKSKNFVVFLLLNCFFFSHWAQTFIIVFWLLLWASALHHILFPLQLIYSFSANKLALHLWSFLVLYDSLNIVWLSEGSILCWLGPLVCRTLRCLPKVNQSDSDVQFVQNYGSMCFLNYSLVTHCHPLEFCVIHEYFLYRESRLFDDRKLTLHFLKWNSSNYFKTYKNAHMRVCACVYTYIYIHTYVQTHILVMPA